MARTVDSPMQVPRDQALARSEVCAAAPGRDGGMARTARCLNTLYEQKRGQVINEWDGAGRAGPSGMLFYRYVPTYGAGEVFNPMSPALYVAPGIFIATMRCYGLNFATWNAMVGAPGWIVPGVNNMIDGNSSSTQTIILEIQQGTVYGVSVGYTRGSAALPATFYGGVWWAVYDDNVTPIDDSWIAGEKPLSVARLDDMRYMARNLYANRLGLIVTKALNSRWLASTEYMEWYADVPTGQWTEAVSWPETAQHLDDNGWYTAEFTVYAIPMAGNVTIHIDCEASDYHPFFVYPAGGASRTFDLRVKASREAGDAPQLVRFALTVDDFVSIVSVCGHWLAPDSATMPR